MYISNHSVFLIKINFQLFFLPLSAPHPVHGGILLVTLNSELFFKFLFYFLKYTGMKTTPEKARKLE